MRKKLNNKALILSSCKKLEIKSEIKELTNKTK
jgi:hypothetical protein